MSEMLAHPHDGLRLAVGIRLERPGIRIDHRSREVSARFDLPEPERVRDQVRRLLGRGVPVDHGRDRRALLSRIERCRLLEGRPHAEFDPRRAEQRARPRRRRRRSRPEPSPHRPWPSPASTASPTGRRGVDDRASRSSAPAARASRACPSTASPARKIAPSAWYRNFVERSKRSAGQRSATSADRGALERLARLRQRRRREVRGFAHVEPARDAEQLDTGFGLEGAPPSERLSGHPDVDRVVIGEPEVAGRPAGAALPATLGWPGARPSKPIRCRCEFRPMTAMAVARCVHRGSWRTHQHCQRQRQCKRQLGDTRSDLGYSRRGSALSRVSSH